jgi:hypothetical protein
MINKRTRLFLAVSEPAYLFRVFQIAAATAAVLILYAVSVWFRSSLIEQPYRAYLYIQRAGKWERVKTKELDQCRLKTCAVFAPAADIATGATRPMWVWTEGKTDGR